MTVPHVELGPHIVVDGLQDVDQGGHFAQVRPPVGEERVRQDLEPEWSTLIGPDRPDTELSFVEPYYAGAKVFPCVVV